MYYNNNNNYIFMETEKIFDLIKDLYTNRVMIDVGAFDGGTFKPFLLNNWNVYAFEPNPNMYRYIDIFIRNNPDYANNLKLEKKCVNDIEQDNLNSMTGRMSYFKYVIEDGLNLLNKNLDY